MNIIRIKERVMIKYFEWLGMSGREPYFVVAVDFDNTLFRDAFPEVGEPIVEVINLCKSLQELEHLKLILWTCRGGKQQVMAVEACHSMGLRFDAINTDLPEIKTYWESRGYTGSQKVSAKYYIDDLALNPYL